MPILSDNSTHHVAKVVRTDRRVLETRDILGDALILLIQEKSFNEITVQQVLDRAGVGRSTFYAHYRDKQDLFLSEVDEFFAGMSTLLLRNNTSPERLAPVKEFLTHLRDARGLLQGLVASGKLAEVMLLGRGHFTRAIEQRLNLPDAFERKAISHALAGSLFALIDWWIDHDLAADPQVIDDLFHRTARKGLSL